MKAHIPTLLIALVTGYLGGISSQWFTSDDEKAGRQLTENRYSVASSPFQSAPNTHDLPIEIEQLQNKVAQLEYQLAQLSGEDSTDSSTEQIEPGSANKPRLNRPVTPDKEKLVSAGVSPDLAEDVLRRISQQEFRRLELQNLIQRDNSNAQYRDELRELNQNKISLRSELGDDNYDNYLYSSGQNNRVEVSSVMAGSPAEISGLQNGDVILLYDNQKILSWPDIRKATVQGEIGSYTNLEVFRNGERMSLMVPRGTLGVQLDATQLDPLQ